MNISKVTGPPLESSWGSPLVGLWKPTQTQFVYYGPECVRKHLLDVFPAGSSKAFIISTRSIAKTHLLGDVERLLGDRHAGTFSNIGQHAPIADLDQAAERVLADSKIDTIISIGGGSPIDSAKAISHRSKEKGGKFLNHITIPTTLSAAECTGIAGFTGADGMKTGVNAPELVPVAIFYDANFALETPPRLWMSTGMRAMDHSMETMYHVTATEMPTRWMVLMAAGELFKFLPKYKENPRDIDTITKLQLASWASLGTLGLNMKGGLGLSHSLGYALGSPYSIPHGITSCVTLGHVVKLKARESEKNAEQIARVAPFFAIAQSGDDLKDAMAVGQAILDLVDRLGLKTDIKADYNVGEDQIPVITKAATRTESGPLYDSVETLVKGLYKL